MKKIIALIILFYSIDSFSQNTEKQVNDAIHSMSGIDIKPEYPEGLEKLNSYINENLLKAGIETKTKTKVYITFVVEKDGSLSDIEINGITVDGQKVNGKVDSRLAEELIRILKSLQKWNSGKQNGKIIRVHYPLLVIIGN
jgi:protein TonB